LCHHGSLACRCSHSRFILLRKHTRGECCTSACRSSAGANSILTTRGSIYQLTPYQKDSELVDSQESVDADCKSLTHVLQSRRTVRTNRNGFTGFACLREFPKGTMRLWSLRQWEKERSPGVAVGRPGFVSLAGDILHLNDITRSECPGFSIRHLDFYRTRQHNDVLSSRCDMPIIVVSRFVLTKNHRRHGKGSGHPSQRSGWNQHDLDILIVRLT
jgi:hypothetical protein